MDIPTMREWIVRWRAMEELRQAWLAVNLDHVARDMMFPVGTMPGDAWRSGGPWDDEDHAVAAGMAGMWP